MNNFGYDDVQGVVIGEVCSVSAVLMYDDRPQGPKMFFKDETAAIEHMRAEKECIVADQGGVADMIYPDDSKWSIKIAQA